jgi:ElaB/YqjD/DUF883 family membrane-anchored ribosome-binding protein
MISATTIVSRRRCGGRSFIAAVRDGELPSVMHAASPSKRKPIRGRRVSPRTRRRGTSMSTEVTTDQLVADLKTVMNDAEALLKATSAQTGEKIQEARVRAEESLRQAKVRLTEIEQEALKRAREVADATEEYVRENPWQSVGIAAGVGLLLGLLLSRR